MEFGNATNLDRKSGVRGTKKTGEAHERFCWLSRHRRKRAKHQNDFFGRREMLTPEGKQWKQIIIFPRTLGRTWGTRPVVLSRHRGYDPVGPACAFPSRRIRCR